MSTETLDNRIDFIAAAADKLALQISERVHNPVSPQEILDEYHHLLDSGEPLHHIHGDDKEARLQKMLIMGGLKLALAELTEQRFTHQNDEQAMTKVKEQWHRITTNPEIKELCEADNTPLEEEVTPEQIRQAIEKVLT